MGVEQDGLGCRVIRRVFYEVKRGPGVTEGNPCSAQVRAGTLRCSVQAVLVCLITMKLHCSARYKGASSYDF